MCWVEGSKFQSFLLKLNRKLSENGFQQFICLYSAVFYGHVEVFPDAQVSWFPAPSITVDIRVVFELRKGRGFCGKPPIFKVCQNGSFQNNVKKSMKFSISWRMKPYRRMFVERPDRPATPVRDPIPSYWQKTRSNKLLEIFEIFQQFHRCLSSHL